MQYNGWDPANDADPDRIVRKKQSVAAALNAGVTMCVGSDVGVFPHGDNARELELMVEYGMKPSDVLHSATVVNAKLMHLPGQIGEVKAGYIADLIVVTGNPLQDISAIRDVQLVIQNGNLIPIHK